MDKTKVVGILGSPRRGGNTEILLDNLLSSAEEAGAETVKFVLNSMKFRPCQECPDITKDGKCKVRDEMQNIFPAVESADVVVIASPIFFGSISAQTKMMIDRFQCQWLGIFFYNSYKVEKMKKGVFISVEASDREDFLLNGKAIVKNLFVTLGASYKYELLCKGYDAKGAIKNSEDCINRSKEIGKLITVK